MVEDDKNTLERIGTFMAKPSGTTPKPLAKADPLSDSALGILAKANESVDLNESHSSRIFQTYPGSIGFTPVEQSPNSKGVSI